MSTVFISYSHDSPEHSGRVLDLAWALRNNGINVELDQFHNEEIVDWPRWCRQQIQRDRSQFVLCVCTAEYQCRIEGAVPPEKGKGVYWEGSLLDDEVYDDKRNRRLVPILFDGEPAASILDFLRGWTFRPTPTPCTRRAAGPRRRRTSARPSKCRPSASPTTRCSSRCEASSIATCSSPPPSAPRGNRVAQASRLRVHLASRPVVLAARHRPNSQPGRLRYFPPAAPSRRRQAGHPWFVAAANAEG